MSLSKVQVWHVKHIFTLTGVSVCKFMMSLATKLNLTPRSVLYSPWLSNALFSHFSAEQQEGCEYSLRFSVFCFVFYLSIMLSCKTQKTHKQSSKHLFASQITSELVGEVQQKRDSGCKVDK